MDFSMDIAEFMMLDDDKRRWMDESALFGVVRLSSRVSAAALFVFATRKLARAIIIGLLECATFFQLCCISRITIACECVYRALRECRANPPPPPPPRGRRRITQQQLFSATREPRLRLLVDLLFRDE